MRIRCSLFATLGLFLTVLSQIANAQTTLSDLTVDYISPHGATIMWRTNVAADATVSFLVQGQPGTERTISLPEKSISHSVNLRGLIPFTNYTYQVKSNGVASTTATFKTIKAIPNSPSEVGSQSKVFYAAPLTNESGESGPLGKSSNLGTSADSPWDLATAFCGGPQGCSGGAQSVTPGSVIFLRGGRYRGSFTTKLMGVEGLPIIIRPLPTEKVILDGFYTTTLAQAISATSTSLTLNDASAVSSSTTVLIDHEYVNLKTKSNSTFSNCERASRSGNTASAHAAGATVTVVDRSLSINGEHVWVFDIDFTNTYDGSANRKFSTDWFSAISQGLVGTGDGVEISPTNKLINSYVHDFVDGIALSTGVSATDLPVNGAEINGTIIYNNGFEATNSGGESAYIQNRWKKVFVKDSITTNGFRIGLKAYVSGANQPDPNTWAKRYLNGVRFNGLISYNNGSHGYSQDRNFRQANLEIAAAACESHPVTNRTDCIEMNDLNASNNITYQPVPPSGNGSPGDNWFFAYTYTEGQDLRMSRNTIIGGITRLGGVADLTFMGNTVAQYGVGQLAIPNFDKVASPANFKIDYNNYFNLLGPTSIFLFGRSSGLNPDFNMTWAQWLALPEAWDEHSTFNSANQTRPPPKIIVEAGDYDSSRAMVAIYNPLKAANINIAPQLLQDMGFVDQDIFELRNAQNPFSTQSGSGDFQKGIYSSSSGINVSMSGSVATPWDYDYTAPTNFPEFGAFILKRYSKDSQNIKPSSPSRLRLTP